MLKYRRLLFSVALTAFLPVSANAQRLTPQAQAAVNATPQQIADGADIQDDNLETSAKISTEPFFTERSGLFNVADNDKYLRAFINKRTCKVTYQLYMWARYRGPWQFFDRVNYESSDGPKSVSAISLRRDVGYCDSRLGCSLIEHLAADIPRSDLEWVAAQAIAGEDKSWKFRVYGRSTQGQDTGILRTEVAGFLIAVDRHFSKLGCQPEDTGTRT